MNAIDLYQTVYHAKGNAMTYSEGSHENFITVTHGMSGWFAVMFWWNPELGGFWEPYTSGEGRYTTKQEAIKEGLSWSDELELEFVMPR